MSSDETVSSVACAPTGGGDPALLGRDWRHDTAVLFKLAVPNVASTVAQTLMSFTDFVIVSRMPAASAAQAAISSASLTFITLLAMPMGTMTCVTTMVSQSLGAGRQRDCAAYAWQGIWMSLLYGMGILLLWPFVPGFYQMFGHEPVVIAMEVQYLQIRLLSLGIAAATISLDNFFNGIHRPGVNTVSACLSVSVNIVLTYVWVLGKLGFPAMGVAGAAWATVVATAIRAVFQFSVMYFGSAASRFEPRKAWRWNREKMRRLCWVGWPAGAAFLTDIAAWTVFQLAIIGRFGTTDLAATGGVFRYLEVSFMPAVGIGMAVSTAVGKAIGQGRPALARRITWIGAGFNAVYMSLMALLFVLDGQWLMRFISPDPAVIQLGATLFVYAAVFQFFDAMAITHNCALRGAGDTMWSSIVGAAEVWIILIGGGVLVARLRPDLGSVGPWAFAAAAVICIGITLFARWRWGPWERLDVIGRNEPARGYLATAPIESPTLPK
ncbi:MAG: MATE family efflux transporter [Phycisphaerae bacterium]|nr:MATE family efflux transporter [Phycisphaerae bacterium]